MASETLFLQPQPLPSSFVPNWGDAKAIARFTNYSDTASGATTSATVQDLVRGGVGVALGAARAFFNNDPAFNLLFASSIGIAEAGAYQVNSQSQARAIASFNIGAGQTFSFDFEANTVSRSKEIENTKAETSQVFSRSAFLIVETTKDGKAKVIDFFGLSGYLDAVKKDDFKLGASRNVRFNSREKRIDINNDNGQDFIIGSAQGTYRETFKHDTTLSIIELTTTTVALRGDTLIGSLGSDVKYGSIWDDRLKGTHNDDKLYASLGDDHLEGRRGDDILEGGQGNDRLEGDEGNDKIYGGFGDDWLTGGVGNDWLVGGEGSDRFVFHREDLKSGAYDEIVDFQPGIDKVVLKGLGANPANWFDTIVAQGLLINTAAGTLLTTATGGKIQFQGLAANQLGAGDFII